MEESLLRAGPFLYILNVHYYNKIALRNKGVKAKSQQEIVKTLKCVIIVIELDEKTKKIYNILGDYPETIAKYMVKRIIKNTKNNVKFSWLTNRRAAFRFMFSSFKKRDFFKDK